MSTQEKLAALAAEMNKAADIAQYNRGIVSWRSPREWATTLITLLSEHGGGGEAGDESIMCEVAVAPATRFSPGVALSTVIAAIKSRRGTERYTFNAKMDRITTPPTPSAPLGYISAVDVRNANGSEFATVFYKSPERIKGGSLAVYAGPPSAPVVDRYSMEIVPDPDKPYVHGRLDPKGNWCLFNEVAALSGVSAPVGVEADLYRDDWISPAEMDKRLETLAEEYEWGGDEVTTITERERMILIDFAHGIMSDDVFVAMMKAHHDPNAKGRPAALTPPAASNGARHPMDGRHTPKAHRQPPAAAPRVETDKAISDALQHGTGVMLGDKHVPFDQVFAASEDDGMCYCMGPDVVCDNCAASEDGLPGSDFARCCDYADHESTEIHKLPFTPFQLRGDLYIAICKWCGQAAPFIAFDPASNVTQVATVEWNRRLAASGQGVEWQPIESAPRSGRELILLLTPSGWPQVAYSNTWWTAGFSVECKPTGWYPIPQPPAAPTQEKGNG